MTVTVGIFDQETEVVRAIRLLREAGVHRKHIRVAAKNAESAPLIAAESDVPFEDLSELRSDGDDGEFVVPVAPAAAGFAPGGAGGASGSGVGAPAVLFGVFDADGDETAVSVLRDIGVPDYATERCVDAVGEGRYLLLTDSGSGVDAPELLHRAGASAVLH